MCGRGACRNQTNDFILIPPAQRKHYKQNDARSDFSQRVEPLLRVVVGDIFAREYPWIFKDERSGFEAYAMLPEILAILDRIPIAGADRFVHFELSPCTYKCQYFTKPQRSCFLVQIDFGMQRRVFARVADANNEPAGIDDPFVRRRVPIAEGARV